MVYKKRVGQPAAWRYHVLDLASGRETALAETRAVDDQAEWLDDSHVLYRVGEDLWKVPADGAGRARRYLAGRGLAGHGQRQLTERPGRHPRGRTYLESA